MDVRYLGTGAAEGIPALFCRCAYCMAARERGEVRTRTQILIDGELSVDFPPDAFYHAARSGVDFSALRYLLVTHSHMDHFYAGDFVLRGYKYAQGMTSPDLTIYGNGEVLEIFREQTARELKPEIREHIRLVGLRPFEPVTFGGYTVHPLMARHSSKDPLLFLIEKDSKRVLHLHDTAKLPEEDYAYLSSLKGGACDLINFDCTFLWNRSDEGARHMGLYDSAEVLSRLEEIGLADGRTKRVITHFSHSSEPTAERLARAEKEFGVLAAYDGMQLTI